MTWKPKKQEVAVTGLDRLWEQYGTWISGAVTVVLAAWLVYVLVGRWNESRLRKGQAELGRIMVDDPGASMRLKALAVDYGNTKVGPQIQLKLAQIMFRAGEYEDAEKTLKALVGDARLTDVDRAQVNLARAYVAQELATQAGQKGDLATEKSLLEEARKRYEVAKEDGLYAAEAKHMLEVLDRMNPVPAPAAPEAPK